VAAEVVGQGTDAASLVKDDLNALLRPWNLLNPDWLRACSLVRLRRFGEARDALQEWIRRERWNPYEKAVARLSREIARLEPAAIGIAV